MTDPIALLAKLVAFRTDAVHGFERPLADHLAELLRAHTDDVTVADVPRAEGKPASYVYARFGTPRLLVNAHLDTVPPNTDWSSDPFVPRIEDGRLYALGAADTKGAAAAIVSALDDVRPRDVGVLFSGDEESTGVAIDAFVAGPHRQGLERAIVCEPTSLRLGVRHRGYVAFDVTVTGPGGHSSKADTMPAPIADLARLAVAYERWGIAQRPLGPDGFQGMCLNLAKLDGGIAFNVIPAQGVLGLSLRPPPGTDTEALAEELRAIAREVLPGSTVRFHRQNAPFATRGSFSDLLPGRETVDLAFWTEAATLARAGIDCVVVGPGDIAQAHAPDEWVPVAELAEAREMFVKVFAATRLD